MILKNHIKYRIIKNIKFTNLLFFLFLSFIIFNWFYFVKLEKLANPDFYKYFFEFKRIISGKIQFRNSTPLFTLLMGLLGKFLSLFINSKDSYILSGRIISLLSSIGFIFYTYKIFQCFTNKTSIIITVFLLISPFFLKLIALPITDITYAFFMVFSFYFLLKQNKSKSIIGVILAALTRYEGFLLIISLIINYLNIIKKNIKKNIIITFFISPLIIIFYIKFANRLTKKIISIFTNNFLLTFITHPEKLIHILYENILFFIPYQYPSLVKWILIYILIIFSFIGFYKIYRQNKLFALSILFYFVSFTFGKGYIISKGSINMLNPNIAFRRMFSFIFIFYFFSIIGLYFFLKYIKEKLKKKDILYYVLIILLTLIILTSKFNFSYKLLIGYLIIFSILFIQISKIKSKLLLKGFLISLLLFFIINIYTKSFIKTKNYYSSAPQKGAYMIAKWANSHLKEGSVLLTYSGIKTIKYYLNKKIALIRIKTKNKNIYSNIKNLREYLIKKFKKYKITYIGIDNYLNFKERPGETAIKIFLNSQKYSSRYFKLIKVLLYKNNYTGCILKFLK